MNGNELRKYSIKENQKNAKNPRKTKLNKRTRQRSLRELHKSLSNLASSRVAFTHFASDNVSAMRNENRKEPNSGDQLALCCGNSPCDRYLQAKRAYTQRIPQLIIEENLTSSCQPLNRKTFSPLRSKTNQIQPKFANQWSSSTEYFFENGNVRHISPRQPLGAISLTSTEQKNHFQTQSAQRSNSVSSHIIHDMYNIIAKHSKNMLDARPKQKETAKTPQFHSQKGYLNSSSFQVAISDNERKVDINYSEEPASSVYIEKEYISEGVEYRTGGVGVSSSNKASIHRNSMQEQRLSQTDLKEAMKLEALKVFFRGLWGC
mgnify:FL=1